MPETAPWMSYTLPEVMGFSVKLMIKGKAFSDWKNAW